MYKFIDRNIISELNNFLSNGEFSSRVWKLIDSNIDNIKHPSDETLFWKILAEFPPIDRTDGDLRKFVDIDACRVVDFRLDKFNAGSLNDPHETKWFSSFLDGLASSNYRDAVSRLIDSRDIFVTYTTRSTTNEHYMYSNYSVNEMNHLKYDYSEVLREFNLIPNAMNVCGYVRYGQNKVDVRTLAKELWDTYGSRPGIKFAMTIMCFFVKSVCARPELEYRFVSISDGNNSSRPMIDLNVIPTKWKSENRDRNLLIHNHFYLNPKRVDRTECGCHPNVWEQSWSSDRKICEVDYEQRSTPE